MSDEKDDDVSPDSENTPLNSESEATVDDDGMISFDDIESLISESDPEFEEEINELKQEAEAEEKIAEEQREDDEIIELSFEERFPKIYKYLIHPYKTIRKTSVLIFSPIFSKTKKAASFLSRQAREIIGAALKFYKIIFSETLPKITGKIKLITSKITAVFSKVLQSYSDLSLKKKGLLYLLLIVVSGTIYMGRETMKGIWIPYLKSKTVYDLAEHSSLKFSFSVEDEWLLLRERFPNPEHQILLKKIVVNLIRKNKFSNPMATIEFYLSLDSQEAAVEVKDRENQILDTIQRIVEGFNYDELNSSTGLYKMKSMIRNQINALLNMGRVKSVFISTIVSIP